MCCSTAAVTNVATTPYVSAPQRSICAGNTEDEWLRCVLPVSQTARHHQRADWCPSFSAVEWQSSSQQGSTVLAWRACCTAPWDLVLARLLLCSKTSARLCSLRSRPIQIRGQLPPLAVPAQPSRSLVLVDVRSRSYYGGGFRRGGHFSVRRDQAAGDKHLDFRVMFAWSKHGQCSVSTLSHLRGVTGSLPSSPKSSPSAHPVSGSVSAAF